MKRLHLICNAHLDPIWQWQWEEGAAAALSTFRVAVEFCEKYDGFVFNHNEALLYQWIEEYEPSLFKRIVTLVKTGKWHIMGGWVLQPDCNMPSGESLVRQILYGKKYFKEKFGVEPNTAVNFDSFGHSRGLVQILAKSGFDSYLFMRPDKERIDIPDEFMWVGFDGSRVCAHRISGYNTNYGTAGYVIKKHMEEYMDREVSLVCWGIGDHGGGPSRIDLESINKLIKESCEVEIIHSTPEAYFEEIPESRRDIPEYAGDLNSIFAGCYSSQAVLKKKHRELENELLMAEKMASNAAMQGLMDYPVREFKSAFYDLTLSEFHDVLPGTSVRPAESDSLRLLDHGLEIASRIKAKAFFALSAGQKAANEGETPVLVYNPHPFSIHSVIECEFMLADQNWAEEFTIPEVYFDGKRMKSQVEKENSTLNLDWRKRVTFEAELSPSGMNRFDCRFGKAPSRPVPQLKPEKNRLEFDNGRLRACINCKTGFIDELCIDGVNVVKTGFGALAVFNDSPDPWRMDTDRFDKLLGIFTLMPDERGTAFSGLNEIIPSVRVIEDGEVRTAVEALFEYNDSAARIVYWLPGNGAEIRVDITVYWNEKDKMLKYELPLAFNGSKHIGQTAFGVQELPADGKECVSQKWNMAVDESSDLAVSIINDGTYGSHFKDDVIYETLLRSPSYCTHPIMERPLVPTDRFLHRMSQGEHNYTLWVNAGNKYDRMACVDRESQIKAEKPMVLSAFPSGEGSLPVTGLSVAGGVRLDALKRAEDGDGWILRLFEARGENTCASIGIPAYGIETRHAFKPYEIKTLRIRPDGSVIECNLTEQRIHGK